METPRPTQVAAPTPAEDHTPSSTPVPTQEAAPLPELDHVTAAVAAPTHAAAPSPLLDQVASAVAAPVQFAAPLPTADQMPAFIMPPVTIWGNGRRSPKGGTLLLKGSCPNAVVRWADWASTGIPVQGASEVPALDQVPEIIVAVAGKSGMGAVRNGPTPERDFLKNAGLNKIGLCSGAAPETAAVIITFSKKKA